MSGLANLTPYGALTRPAMDSRGRDVMLAVTAARYRLPRPGDAHDAPLALDDVQPPPAEADVHHADAGTSGLRFEAQLACGRPATDVTVVGHARSRGGQAVTTLLVGVTIGPVREEMVITGDRRWARDRLDALIVTPPEPFVTLPLTWERAYGGTVRDADGNPLADEPRNPVGTGFVRRGDDPTGRPLPNIESPRHRIGSAGAKPVPVGLGAVARWWQPRARYAGTYDETWLRERAPVWPDDLDERFFCAAPETLQARPHLRGGEAVHLRGLHVDGDLGFRLPAPAPIARFRYGARTSECPMILDAVVVEPDTGHITLVHRASDPVRGGIADHRETVIREVQFWERRFR